MIWTAAGLLTVDAWVRGRLPRLRAVAMPVTLLLCLLWLAADIAGMWLIAAPVEYRALGVWMRANGVTAADTVLARKRQVPFYAGARWDWLPFGDTADLLTTAAERGAGYAVIDQRTTPTLRPALAYLLDPAQAPAALQLVHQLVAPAAILLYRVVPAPP